MTYNRNRGGDNMGINERFGAENVEETQAPPAWLTAAVLAALPCDGTILDHQAIVRTVCATRGAFTGDDVTAALDSLVASGEVETDNIHGVRWRRWGAPEGWVGWVDCGQFDRLARTVEGAQNGCLHVATAHDHSFTIYESEVSDLCVFSAGANDRAAARTAALRACYERGVFGPRPVAAPATSTPQGAGMGEQVATMERIRERLTALLAKGPRKAIDLLLDVLACGAPGAYSLTDLRTQLVEIGARRVYAGSGERWEAGSPATVATAPTNLDAIRADAIDRPALVRLALLAVLTRGPVATRGMLLPIVEGEMGAPAGSVEPSEARQAAREIGAEVDGPRWSLPAMPPGFQWIKSYTQGEVYYLAPIAYADMRKDQIARVEEEHGMWDWKLSHDGEWHTCDSLADGQRQALAAARRAGLFDRPVAPAVEVTGDGGPTVLPVVTALDGAPIVYPAPHGPLDAAVLAILATASCAEITAHLKAWGDQLIEQARESVVLYYAAERARMMGGPPEDFRDMSEMGEGPGVEPIPHATVQASLAQRAYAADAPLLYAVWQAAQRVREARQRVVQTRGADGETMAIADEEMRAAFADLFRALDQGEPRDPHPHRNGNEEPWETIGRLARERDDARRELEAMETHGDKQRERAKQAEREVERLADECRRGASSLREARERAGNAEAKLATLGAEIDALHARWAGAK